MRQVRLGGIRQKGRKVILKVPPFIHFIVST